MSGKGHHKFKGHDQFQSQTWQSTSSQACCLQHVPIAKLQKTGAVCFQHVIICKSAWHASLFLVISKVQITTVLLQHVTYCKSAHNYCIPGIAIPAQFQPHASPVSALELLFEHAKGLWCFHEPANTLWLQMSVWVCTMPQQCWHAGASVTA